MEWSSERYVRVYTRDTGDILAVGWEGRVVLWELLRKADRAGIVDHGGDSQILAEMLRLPHEVTAVGLDRLIGRGVVQLASTAIIIRNFREAQEASATGPQRNREWRARQRDIARAGRVIGMDFTPDASKGDTETENEQTISFLRTSVQFLSTNDANETKRLATETKRLATETERDGARLRAVLCCAVPIREGEKNREPPNPPLFDSPGSGEPGWEEAKEPLAARPKAAPSKGVCKRKKAKPLQPTEGELAIVETVLGKIRDWTGRDYSPQTDAHVKLIIRLLRRGYSEDDLRAVVWAKGRSWGRSERMEPYLRPSTLFSESRFPEYLAEARSEEKKTQRVNGSQADAPASLILGLMGQEDRDD